MAICKVENDKLIELENTSFEYERIYEVSHLQNYLSNAIQIIDKDLLVISTEFSDWEDSDRRIDILCVDSEANLVVIELKRTKDGAHMELQAIRYSAMIAKMKFETAVNTYAKYLKKINSDLDAKENLLKFLEWDEILEDKFAQDVKIILVSADFSKELTTSVLWLNEKYIDFIRCVRVKPQKDGEKLYFDIQQIIPLPESADYQVRLKEKADEEREISRENKRERSIFKHLFESDKLHIGQKVILKPAIEQGHPIEKATATIINTGQNCLKREGDNKLYSFSKLRTIWTDELNLQDVKPNWGFSLKHDWIDENKRELAALEDR